LSELLKRTFDLDHTGGPNGGGCVRGMAAIIRKEAIEEILGHLNLPPRPAKRAEAFRTEYVPECFA